MFEKTLPGGTAARDRVHWPVPPFAMHPLAAMLLVLCALPALVLSPALAEIAGSGPDGLSTDNIINDSDFIAFINAFAVGC